MAKATMVYIWENDKISPTFSVIGKVIPSRHLQIMEVKDGFVIIEPYAGDNIVDFAEIIAGCFNEDSNFFAKVLQAYDYDASEITFKGIKFVFNDVPVTVTKENADVEKILQQWHPNES